MKLCASCGTVFEIDDDDYAKISKGCIYIEVRGYVTITFDHLKRFKVHRILMGAQQGQIVDHVDGNKLNNKKSNLRFVTRAQNGMNRGKQCNNTSGFKGVSFHSRDKVFQASIKVGKRMKYLGSFQTAELAFEAYKNAAATYHGEFARAE